MRHTVHRPRHESARHVRTRLAVAVFVLTMSTAGGLGSGVAGADDGMTGAGAGSGTTGSTSLPSESQPDSKPSSKPSSEPSSKPTAEPSPTSEPSSKPTATPSSKPTAKPEPTKPEPTATQTPATDAPTAPDTAAPAIPTQTVPTEILPTQTAPTREPTRHTAPTGATPATNATPTPEAAPLLSAKTQTPTSTRSQPQAPVVRSVAPLAIAATPTATVVTPAPTIQPRLDLQVAGLVVDVGTVMVSVVHTAATIVAQAFGPSSFLGVPYLLAVSVANAAAAVGRTLVGGPLAEPAAGRFGVNYGILDGLGFFTPTTPPAGANDPSITVTPEHPLPIILVNGTTATQGANWSVAAPVLANAGYKVYTFNYGNTTSNPNWPIQSIGDIRTSGLELAAEVDRVLAETVAPKVILIGHSQGGGILPAYYLNVLGGAAKVSQLIGVAPSNHGTDFDYLTGLQSIPVFGQLLAGIADAIGPALFQQAVGSPLMQQVYGNGDTRPGVLYTTIASINDEVVTPYTQQALTGANVTNVVLQQRYPGLVIGHANIFLSPRVMDVVLDALAGNPAANPLPAPTILAA